MPKTKEVSNHPCHLLSLPSAKRFWCRHCMTVFEDAITRWHHSRSCRYGVVTNFMRRRELEAKALQNTTVLNPVEARLEHSIQMSDLASRNVDAATTSKQESVILPEQDSFTCFICHQKFLSMEEMRMHVKFPCSNSKIITSHVPHPKHSVPVFLDNMPVRQQWQQNLHPQDQVHHSGIYRQTHIHQSEQSNADVKSDQELETNYDSSTLSFNGDKNGPDTITPTNIYVNELGETVIEVENLDLNTEGAELSLAHLLTQLSQQGIVFDKTRTAELQCKQEISGGGASNILYTTETAYEEVIKDEEEQPTAEDAANTLAQLAGFRSFRNNQQTYEISTGDDKPPIQTVEGYNYSDYIGGPTIVSSQSEMDITYRYEYTESNEQCEETNVTGQASHQAHCKYDNKKTDMGSGTQIRVVYDSASGKYVPLSAAEHSMELDEEVNCNDDTPDENQVTEDGTKEIIAEQYTEQCKAGQLTEADEENGLNSAVLDNNEVMVNTNKNDAKSCSSSEEKVQDTEDFTVPALSLQEIVDTNHIEFEVQLTPTSHLTEKTVGSMSQKPLVKVDAQNSVSLDIKTELGQFSQQSSQENTTVFVEAQTEMQAISEKC